MEELIKLHNIGETLADKLMTIGIKNLEDLTNIGSVEAVIKIGETDSSSCYNMLYAIEGAIQKVRWHNIPKEERAILKAEYDLAKMK